jgi:hypothetical protein
MAGPVLAQTSTSGPMNNGTNSMART